MAHANCRKNPNDLIEVSIPDKETVIVKDRAKDWYLITYKDKNCWTNKINLRQLSKMSIKEVLNELISFKFSKIKNLF